MLVTWQFSYCGFGQQYLIGTSFYLNQLDTYRATCTVVIPTIPVEKKSTRVVVTHARIFQEQMLGRYFQISKPGNGRPGRCGNKHDRSKKVGSAPSQHDHKIISEPDGRGENIT